MEKGRKTTLEERIEIVSYCIAHGKDLSLIHICYLCGGNGKNHVLLEYISETAAEPEPVADIIALLN